MTTHAHTLDSSHSFCSCGQDAVTCQVCGEQFCSNFTSWVNVGVLLNRNDRNFMGNACPECFEANRKD